MSWRNVTLEVFLLHSLYENVLQFSKDTCRGERCSSAEYDGHAVRRTMGLNGVHPSRFVKRNVCLQETCFPDESVLVVIEVY
jgi:hypothetical protein